MLDFIAFAETHEFLTTLLVCVLLSIGYGLWKGIPKAIHLWRVLRNEWDRRNDIPERLDEICAKLKYQSHKIEQTLNELNSRCDVHHCPGLALLRDEFHAMERDFTNSVSEIRRSVEGTSDEVRQGVYALLDTVKAALLGTGTKSDPK